jgi:hypothetical protein
MAAPCVPVDPGAKQILDSCAAAFADNKDDCNKFLKAALSGFLPVGYLDNLDADGIVGKLRSQAEGWDTSRTIDIAIAKAKSGNLVVAGMTGASLGQHHGHLAVVVGCDGLPSAGTTVPVGYAGSLGNPAAQIEGASLSRTFEATLVRSEGVDYYFKMPDPTPT